MKLNELLESKKIRMTPKDFEGLHGDRVWFSDEAEAGFKEAENLPSFKALTKAVPEEPRKAKKLEYSFGPVDGVRPFYFKTDIKGIWRKLNNAHSSSSWAVSAAAKNPTVSVQNPLDVKSTVLAFLDNAFDNILRDAQFEMKMGAERKESRSKETDFINDFVSKNLTSK